MSTPPVGIYEPRNPHASPLFALVEDYYEEFERVYDERYRQQYGPWRKIIGEVLRKFLDCGDLHCGFSGLRCGSCRYRTILAYSCKCRVFCPACQQKRVLLFAGWLDSHILEQVGQAQYVFTIPKLLRPLTLTPLVSIPGTPLPLGRARRPERPHPGSRAPLPALLPRL